MKSPPEIFGRAFLFHQLLKITKAEALGFRFGTIITVRDKSSDYSDMRIDSSIDYHTYRMYICHAWYFSHEYENFMQELTGIPLFYYANLSIREVEPIDRLFKDRIQSKVVNQISQCEIVVVLAEMFEDWQNQLAFEIQYSHSIGLPVLAIMSDTRSGPINSTLNSIDQIISLNNGNLSSAIKSLVDSSE